MHKNMPDNSNGAPRWGGWREKLLWQRWGDLHKATISKRRCSTPLLVVSVAIAANDSEDVIVKLIIVMVVAAASTCAGAVAFGVTVAAAARYEHPALSLPLSLQRGELHRLPCDRVSVTAPFLPPLLLLLGGRRHQGSAGRAHGGGGSSSSSSLSFFSLTVRHVLVFCLVARRRASALTDVVVITVVFLVTTEAVRAESTAIAALYGHLCSGAATARSLGCETRLGEAGEAPLSKKHLREIVVRSAEYVRRVNESECVGE
jgi:hypothetical protein